MPITTSRAIQALEDRGHDAREQQPHGELVGGGDAAEQRARQHQQGQADDAAGQVRDLQDRQRQDLPQQRGAAVDGGRGA
jgi:hypothetical protein